MTTVLPIAKVVVMEDRAQVERTGQVTVHGLTRVEIGPVALVAVDRSLEVSAEGASLLDARLVRRRRERPAGGMFADATALRKEVQAADRALVVLADHRGVVQTRVDALAHARVDVLRGIAEGAGAGQVDPALWTKQLDDLATAQRDADERMRIAHRDHALGERRVAEARNALTQAEPPEPELECMLVLSLDGPADTTTEARITARYQVPCAAWRPAYRARLDAAAVTIDADAVVWQRTGEDWHDVTLALSTARPTLGTTPPSLFEDRLTTRPKQDAEKRTVEVAVREVAIETTGEGGADELPGVDDGGETRLLAVPSKVRIPSDGMPHRVRLFEFAAPAETRCVCTPELAPEAVVVARFDNRATVPLLAGPVDLVRTSGSVGRATLPFTAIGERIALSFGSEDGVSVLRDEQVERDTSRLTGKLTRTTTVTLHVSNASAVARTLQIEERVLVSEVKEVEVEVMTKACSPAPREVDTDGIARIELELPANGTRTAKLVWEVVASGKVSGI